MSSPGKDAVNDWVEDYEAELFDEFNDKFPDEVMEAACRDEKLCQKFYDWAFEQGMERLVSGPEPEDMP